MDELEQLRRLTGHVETAGRRVLNVERTQAEAERQLAEAQGALRELHAELTRPSRSSDQPGIGAASQPFSSDIANSRHALALARVAGEPIAEDEPAPTPDTERRAIPPKRRVFGIGRLVLLMATGMGVAGAALALVDGGNAPMDYLAGLSHNKKLGAHEQVAGMRSPVQTIAVSPPPTTTVANPPVAVSMTSPVTSFPATPPAQSTGPADQPINQQIASLATAGSSTESFYAKRFAGIGSAERECLAQAVYYEARGEPVAGQIAVAQVVLNRTMTGSWPDTVCGVVRQGQERGEKCQFSFACMRSGLAKPNGESWQQASWIANEVLNGGAWLRELTEATHYHRTDLAPVWRLALREIGRIGIHVFYGPPGSRQMLGLEFSGDGGVSQRVPFSASPTTASSSIVRRQDIGRNAAAASRQRKTGPAGSAGNGWQSNVTGQ